MSGHSGHNAVRIMERKDLSVIGRTLVFSTKAFAVCGGLGFTGMVFMSLVSVVGRKLWAAPINGDIEIVQVITAVAAAALIPYCTLAGEHLKVDFFTEHLPAPILAWLDSFAYAVMTAVFALITWRTFLHAIDMRESGEVTTLREIPVWIPVLSMVPSLTLVTLCAAYRCISEFRTKGDPS